MYSTNWWLSVAAVESSGNVLQRVPLGGLGGELHGVQGQLDSAQELVLLQRVVVPDGGLEVAAPYDFQG